MSGFAHNSIILETRGITKSFPGVRALKGVDFKVYRGKLNALVGENGAGKSTLMKILSGVYTPDEGEILFDGRPIQLRNTREALAHRIAIIHQELNLVPYLSIAENIYLGREFCTPLGTIDFRRMNAETARLLKLLELDVDPRTPVADLRVGQQQIVEIAKALSIDARVIIMDEPTSAISEHEIDLLFRIIENLKANGVAIVYITHKMDELYRIGDHVTVLRDGAYVGEGALSELDQDSLVRMMVGRELVDLFAVSPSIQPQEALRVEGISLKRPGHDDYLVADVSFHVRRGEVLGIFGLMGAGRTELFETIFGLHHGHSGGQVFVHGEPVAIRSPHDAIAAGIGFASEDRKQTGLVQIMSVADNISLACLPRVESMGFISAGAEEALAQQYVASLNIKTPSTRQQARNLSGGNQQKIVLAKWLATEPDVLLLDEPTRGIDIQAKQEIYGVIDELTRMGLGVVMVSSELPEILGVADRIIVMSEGRKTAEFARENATEEILLKAALPRMN